MLHYHAWRARFIDAPAKNRRSECPLWVDCVEKVCSGGGVGLAGAVTVAGAAYMAGIGSGIAINLAILRRF